jgi:BMFP domain-containing protein YqiC
MTEPPRDWFHYNAKQAEALDRLERRVAALEAALAAGSQQPAAASQEPPEARLDATHD